MLYKFLLKFGIHIFSLSWLSVCLPFLKPWVQSQPDKPGMVLHRCNSSIQGGRDRNQDPLDLPHKQKLRKVYLFKVYLFHIWGCVCAPVNVYHMHAGPLEDRRMCQIP